MSARDWKDLLTAAGRGDLAGVRYHLDHGVDPNYQHPELLTTPLIVSIEQGHGAVTRCLLENGADPHLPAGFSRDTPLVVARRLRNREAIALLKPFQPTFLERVRAWFRLRIVDTS